MQIELNFEAGLGGNIAESIAQFECLASGYVVRSRVEAVCYNGPDGEVVTETAVVRINCDPRIVVGIAYELAIILNEDCIAVRFNDVRGLLVGPNAAKWGEFNPDFFIRF